MTASSSAISFRPAVQPGELGIGQVADRHVTSERPSVRAVIGRTLATVDGGPQGLRRTARKGIPLRDAVPYALSATTTHLGA